MIVDEGRDFVLGCLCPNTDLTGGRFYWDHNGSRAVFEYKEGFHSRFGCRGQARQFYGRVSHFPEALKSGFELPRSATAESTPVVFLVRVQRAPEAPR